MVHPSPRPTARPAHPQGLTPIPAAGAPQTASSSADNPSVQVALVQLVPEPDRHDENRAPRPATAHARDETLDRRVIGASRLNRARDIEPAYDDESPGAVFEQLLKEGPDVGVHVLVTCDKTSSLERRLGRAGLRELGIRIGFSMSAEDSESVFDGAVAAGLHGSQAVFEDQDEGVQSKFRSWEKPTPELLVSLANGAR